MHDHGELARLRHERALMTAFGRKAQAPRTPNKNTTNKNHPIKTQLNTYPLIIALAAS